MIQTRPNSTTLALAAVGGLANVAVVLALYARAEYPVLESLEGVTLLALLLFVLGAVPVFVSAYTRLLAPAAGLLAVLAGTVYLEITTPMPEWSERGGYVIVDGPTHVASYANTWFVWLALLVVAGVVEFAIRRGYGLEDEPQRLRNLPELPLSRGDLVRTVAGFAVLVGVATTLLSFRSGLSPSVMAIAIFAGATVATAVALAALLARGAIAPILLFALVPYWLTVEVFVTTDSPVHLLLVGPYALVLAVAWGLEELCRSRLWGWNGGRFVEREPT